jgi:acetyl-CoA carboxylase biotin carboxyl carrier protein
VDLDRLERVLRLFERSRARELRVETESWRVAFRRGASAFGGTTISGPATSLEAEYGGMETESTTRRITAPLVGIFREAKDRLAPGDRVLAGTPVGAIESMKILSPVLAEADGLIEEVMVEDGHPVEYGEPLFSLRPLEAPVEEEGDG